MEQTIVGVGKSIIGNAKEAGIEASQKALKGLKNASPVFALIFSSAGYNQEQLLEGIISVIGNIPMSGCTGEGIITPEGSDEGSAAIGIMLFSSNKIKFENFIIEGLEKNSYKCGEILAKKINESKGKEKGTLMLYPDSLTVNITEVFRAFADFLKVKILILGGTTGDMMQLKKTYQYYNGKVYTDAIAAVYITGDYAIDWLVSHGCEEIGLEQTVTKTDKNCIIKIDEESAWDVLRKYLPSKPEKLNAEDAFHFCIGEVHKFNKPLGEQLVIRTPVGLIDKTGALKFSVEIPQNTKIHFTRRDPQVIAQKLLIAFKELLERNKNKKVLAVLQYDCAGRGQVIYGDNLNKMIFSPLQKLLPPTTPWIGFHTYGEIAPIGGEVFYHNFTAVIGVLFDK